MICIQFFLGLMYIVPVLKGCSLLQDNVLNVYGIENEIIYLDIGQLFALEQENYLVLEPILQNIRIINRIELEMEFPLQLDGDPFQIKFPNTLNENTQSKILIIDENYNFMEYSLVTNQITKLKVSDYDQSLDLLDVVQLTDQDKKYLILDFSLIGQTYIEIYQEAFNMYEYMGEYKKEFFQNSRNNKLVGSGNTVYRLNYIQIEIYQIEIQQIEKPILKPTGYISKSKNEEKCGPIQNIIKIQIHKNSISFIDSNTLVITQLSEDNENYMDQQCIIFKDKIYAYDYYEPLDQYVVISGNQLVFGNFKRNLNVKVFQYETKVYLTQNYILFVLGPNIELYSKELIFLDQIQNQNEFLIEVQPEADKFVMIDKYHAKQFQLIQSPIIKISEQNEEVDFVLRQITEQQDCNLQINYFFRKLNYDSLFVKLQTKKFVPSTQWDINDCKQEQKKSNLLTNIKQRNQQKKTKSIRELPSSSKKQYLLLEDENNEVTLIVQSELLNSYEEFSFKLDIEGLQEIENQLWWVTDDEVYLAFYIQDTCYIFKLDYGIPNLMHYNVIKVDFQILKIVSSGNFIFMLVEQKANTNELLYSQLSEVRQEYKKIQLPTIKDIFASPLQQDYIIIKLDRQLIIYRILYVPVQIFNEIAKPLQTNVIIFQNYFVLLMKSKDEKEKICDIYFFRSAQSIEKLGRNSLEQFSKIQIEDVLVSTKQNVFYLKCQVKLQEVQKYALVGFKVGISIYKSLLFILLRNINSEYQTISQFLIKLNHNQLMPIIKLRDSEICLIEEDNEVVIDVEQLKEDIDIVDNDNKPPILDNGDNNKDNQDDKSDDNTLDLDKSNFPIGSFLVMSTIEEALIFSLFKTFGRRRLESIDVV